ncbi:MULTISPECIES: hypothetical protein [Pseudoalteromonas]|jgi:hypothetical protein|uniref:Orphan protein n=1 Tax=Pseudoalteromonas marina TaxID=267375 RepID=A0ABT9FGP6_9GAMM|nr:MULTISPECIES: hypothetical protein [Pseudoalteromonas]KAF7778343.1 hypothetical protein PMAN_a3183 [Pseudoalteromonas marina]MCK8121186.1 hypothetical protein [Pseudoalteromonas sp. 2CM32C]MDP2565951.1 hypothetical protein [Pseudoalteromonas marina]
MQISANSQVQMQAYNKTQQLQPLAQQTTSTKTLQSDTVSFSQEGLSAASADLSRSAILLPELVPKKPK